MLEMVTGALSQRGTSSSTPRTANSSGTCMPTRVAAAITALAISSFAANTAHGLGNLPSRSPSAASSDGGSFVLRGVNEMQSLPYAASAWAKAAPNSFDQSARPCQPTNA